VLRRMAPRLLILACRTQLWVPHPSRAFREGWAAVRSHHEACLVPILSGPFPRYFLMHPDSRAQGEVRMSDSRFDSAR